MPSIEITEMVKTLQTERAQTRKELAKLDKVISALLELNGTNPTPSPNGKRHAMSAAARRKIGKAQKARWAKVRQAQKTKG
jgi:hypothetical protein